MNISKIDVSNIERLETEEATKMALIMPFIQELGYNVFNVDEVVPEFTADIAKRKGEKIDYAIKIDSKIAFVIEAKHVKENLDNHSKQLARYFVNTDAKIAILTNGIEYRFFTDIDKDNVMDLEPFFTFDLNNHSKKDVEYLEGFTKDNFDENKLYGKAEVSRHIDIIVAAINEEFSNPTEEFVKLLMDKSYSGIKTKSVVEEYTNYTQLATSKFIKDKVSEKLSQAFPEIIIDSNPQQVVEEKKQVVNTTQNEMEIYSYIKVILQEHSTNITFKDNQSYFNVLLDGKVTKWICRVYDRTQLQVVMPSLEGDIEVTLENTLEIFNYKEQIIKSFEMRK